MAIAAGTLAKVGIGLGALGAGVTGVYFVGGYVNNSLSEYDRALIEFLNEKDNDFVFEIKKSDGSSDFGASDVKIETTSGQKVSVVAKVQVSTKTNSIFKKGTAAATDADKEFSRIKNLNPGQD